MQPFSPCSLLLLAFVVASSCNTVNAQQQEETSKVVGKEVRKKVASCFADVNGAKFNDTVTVHYTGKLKSNGEQFDSSIGGEPISFELGGGLVIRGWEEGLRGTCPGEKVVLDIPSELGYGEKGAGNGVIPPNADLIFEIEMVDIARSYHEEMLVSNPCSKKTQSRDQDIIKFNYVGRLPNGTIFGETDEETGPLMIEIGMTGIKGWDKALTGMCEGEVKRAYLPPSLAYGKEGIKGLVPADSVVVLDVEMVNIQDRVLSFLFKTSQGTAFSGRRR